MAINQKLDDELEDMLQKHMNYAQSQQQSAQAQQYQDLRNHLTDAQRYMNGISVVPNLNVQAKEMLISRLAGLANTFKLKTDDFLQCHVTKDMVYIFFVFDGKGGNTSEDISIFPSDKLITQLRLIRA